MRGGPGASVNDVGSAGNRDSEASTAVRCSVLPTLAGTPDARFVFRSLWLPQGPFARCQIRLPQPSLIEHNCRCRFPF